MKDIIFVKLCKRYLFVSCMQGHKVLKMEILGKLLDGNDHSDRYLRDKSWQGVIESRLLALDDTGQRQHAFKMFLEFLNLSVCRLSHILGLSGVHYCPNIQQESDFDIYQIHQLRMSLRNSCSGMTGNSQQSQTTFEDEKSKYDNSVHFCIGNINHILYLFKWLMESLWSESFFVQNVTEKCNGGSHGLLCAKLIGSDSWVPIFQKFLQLLQGIREILGNVPGKGSVENAFSKTLAKTHFSDTVGANHGNEFLDIGHAEESLKDHDTVLGLNSDSVKGTSRPVCEDTERSVKDSDCIKVFNTDHARCELDNVHLNSDMNGDPSFMPLKGHMMKTVKEITDILQHLLGPEREAEPEVAYKIKFTDSEASSGDQNYEAKTLDQLMHHVDERLECYEDVFWEILTNSSHQQNLKWLEFVQRNTDLLLNRRSLHFLLEFASQEGPPLSDVLTVVDILKLCLKCLGSLPLTIFNDIHKWLWSSPKRCQILLDSEAEEYYIELNETFNKLTRCDTSKLAVQVGCLLLQRPKATLWRALQDIRQNQEAVKTLCEVIQCLPAVEDFCLPGQDTTVLFEVLSTALHETKWKKAEESNLLNFAVKVCQPFQSNPELPFQHQALVSCDVLLKQLVLPSLTRVLDREQLVCSDTEGSKHIPMERSLRLLAKILHSCSQYIPVEVLSPLLLCLCELFEIFSRRNGSQFSTILKAKNNIMIKELILESLEVVCRVLEGMGSDGILCKDPTFQQDLLLLWENLDHFHWTTKLRVSFSLSSVASYFKEYYSNFMDSIPIMLQHCDSASKEEQLILWISILYASSISENLAEKCCEVCSKMALQLPDHFSLSHQSLVVSLAHCLPSSTRSEWGNMAVLVRGLLVDVLDVPYYSEFTSYLPVNLQGISAALSFSQMILSVLEISFQTSCDGESHQHIIKCYMLAIQNLLLMYHNDRHDNKSKLFLAGQIFCQACFAMTFVPFECQETLIVLTLEVLGHVEAICRSEVNNWYLVQEDMLRAVDWCSSPGDRNALMKKLQELDCTAGMKRSGKC